MKRDRTETVLVVGFVLCTLAQGIAAIWFMLNP